MPTMTKMEKDETVQPIDLVGFSVVLVAELNNPTIVTADFLRYNEIVDKDLELLEDPVTTPAFSRIAFRNGLVVTADPARVLFEQTAESLPKEKLISPEVAQRYVNQVPHVPYHAVGINPKGHRSRLDGAPERVSNAIHDQGAWMSFKDIDPKIGLKVTYRSEKRTINLTIDETGSGILFQANFHYDCTGSNQDKRIKALLSVVGIWEQVLSDFDGLTKKFNLNRFAVP